MLNLSHLLAIVPIALLLTLSFFVLLTVRKVEEKGLKIFGYLVVSLLWLAALVVFSGVIYNVGKCSIMNRCMMQEKSRSGCLAQVMQQNKMPDVEKHAKISKCCGNKGVIFKTE